MEVKELKNKYGGRADKWVPVDKAAARYLPKDREYTKLEALFSYQKDLDEGKQISISGYSRLWQWSRNKVRKFLNDLETDEGHLEDTLRTGRGQAIHVINKNLWDTKGQARDRRGTGEGQMKDTTINPNPNPNKKNGRFMPPTTKEVEEYGNQINFEIDGERFCAYYESRGWYLSKGVKMKSWKQAVVTWKKNWQERNKSENDDWELPGVNI